MSPGRTAARRPPANTCTHARMHARTHSTHTCTTQAIAGSVIHVCAACTQLHLRVHACGAAAAGACGCRRLVPSTAGHDGPRHACLTHLMRSNLRPICLLPSAAAAAAGSRKAERRWRGRRSATALLARTWVRIEPAQHLKVLAVARGSLRRHHQLEERQVPSAKARQPNAQHHPLTATC